MTHKNIYEKFMIEYDKANITSSYPSLTKYEVATFLDKAYQAIIAQKLTGNNIRRIGFEGDVKAVEDLKPLITVDKKPLLHDTPDENSNEYLASTPDNYLYYISAEITGDYGNRVVNIVSHRIANNFKVTRSNYPWVKDPVTYVESDGFHVLIDPEELGEYSHIVITYIREPQKFTDGGETEPFSEHADFELSDEMAEELINMAIIFATETTESPRMQSKVSINAFES